MKKILGILVVVSFLWVVGTGVAGADDYLRLNDGWNNFTQTGVYAGPYGMQFVSVNSGDTPNFANVQVQPLICDDYFSHISFGESWQVNTYVWNQADPDSVVQHLKLFNGDVSQSVLKYERVFWLGIQMMAPQNASDPNIVVPMHYALWQILSGDAPPYAPGGSYNDSNYWYNQAMSAVTAGNSPDFTGTHIYVPLGLDPLNLTGSPQEFIGPVDPVPIPQSFLLLAPGMFGLTVMRKRFKK